MLRHGIGWVAVLVLAAGVVLGAGGQWSLVFVVPALAANAPEVLTTGVAWVTAGYMVPFITLAVGGVLLGTALLRAHAVPRWAGVLVVVGDFVCVAPLPARFFLLTCGVSAVAALTSRRSTAARQGAPVPA